MTDALKSLVAELIGKTDPPELIPAVETKEERQRRQLKEKQRRASRDAMRRLYARRKAMGLNAHGKPFAVRRQRNKSIDNRQKSPMLGL